MKGPGDLGEDEMYLVSGLEWRSMSNEQLMKERRFDVYDKMGTLIKSDFFIEPITKSVAYAFLEEQDDALELFQRLGLDELDAYAVLEMEDPFDEVMSSRRGDPC